MTLQPRIPRRRSSASTATTAITTPTAPTGPDPATEAPAAAGVRRRRHLWVVPDRDAPTPGARPVERDLPPAARRADLDPLPTAERGVTTAEYAVATAAGAGFAGLLFHLLTGGLGERLIGTLFDHALALLGVG